MGSLEAGEVSKQAEAVWHAALTEDNLIGRLNSPKWRGPIRTGNAFEILGFHYLKLFVLKSGEYLIHPDKISRVSRILTPEEQDLKLPPPDGIRYRIDQYSQGHKILQILGFVEYKIGRTLSNEQLGRYATLINRLKNKERAVKFMKDLLGGNIDVEVTDNPEMFFVVPSDVRENISPTNFPYPFTRIAFPQTLDEIQKRIKKERENKPNH